MAVVADDDDIGGSSVYTELRDREEQSFAQRGGQTLLVGDRVEVNRRPGRLLAALRAGQPATVYDWQLPRLARDGRVKNVRVTVHADGRMVEVD
jgi:hypothetical protein